jgi:hypothetical protein
MLSTVPPTVGVLGEVPLQFDHIAREHELPSPAGAILTRLAFRA